MDVADELLTFLETRDAPFCFPCLARAFPHIAVRERIERARQAGAPLLIDEGRCSICRLTTNVVAYVPGDLGRWLPAG